MSCVCLTDCRRVQTEGCLWYYLSSSATDLAQPLGFIDLVREVVDVHKEAAKDRVMVVSIFEAFDMTVLSSQLEGQGNKNFSFRTCDKGVDARCILC